MNFKLIAAVAAALPGLASAGSMDNVAGAVYSVPQSNLSAAQVGNAYDAIVDYLPGIVGQAHNAPNIMLRGESAVGIVLDGAPYKGPLDLIPGSAVGEVYSVSAGLVATHANALGGVSGPIIALTTTETGKFAGGYAGDRSAAYGVYTGKDYGVNYTVAGKASTTPDNVKRNSVMGEAVWSQPDYSIVAGGLLGKRQTGQAGVDNKDIDTIFGHVAGTASLFENKTFSLGVVAKAFYNSADSAQTTTGQNAVEDTAIKFNSTGFSGALLGKVRDPFGIKHKLEVGGASDSTTEDKTNSVNAGAWVFTTPLSHDTKSVWAHDTIKFGDLTVTGGVRKDSTTWHNQITDPTKSLDKVSPIGAANYILYPGVSVFANASGGIVRQTAAGSSSAAGVGGSDPFYARKNVEAGFRANLADGWGVVSVAAFKTDTKKETLLTVGGVDDADVARTGVDVEYNGTFGPFGTSASYVYTQAKTAKPITLYNGFNAEELNGVPGIPESVFKVRVDYSVPSTIPYVGKYLAGLNVGATGKYVKNQDYTITPVGTGGAAVPTTGKSFTTFDLDAKYKVSAKWSAFAVAKNITNQNITRQSAGLVSGGHSDTDVDKAQGRTLWIGAEYNF